MILGHDIKTQKPVEVSLDKSRVVFVTGKRGSGKSYTLGVLAEELYLQGSAADQKTLILMVDPLGIFFTFCCPNPFFSQADAKFAIEPQSSILNPQSAIGLPVRLLVPGDPATRYGEDVVERMESLGVCFQSLRLNPSGLSPSEWCDLPSLEG